MLISNIFFVLFLFANSNLNMVLIYFSWGGATEVGSSIPHSVGLFYRTREKGQGKHN